VDLGPGKMVSRKHARIAYEDEEWWITVDGRNGLKADGSSVAMNEKVILSNGYISAYDILLTLELFSRSGVSK